MRKHRTGAFLMLMLALAPLCCGCLEATSLDEYGYVLTIGVDQGEQKKYNISFLLQKEGDSQEAQTGAGSYIITAEGDNLFDALTVVHVGVPYELNFTRTNFILLSDQIASSSRMDEFLSISFNALKLRQSAKLVIVRGTCAEYFEGLASADIPNVAKRQYNLFRTYQQEGMIPMTNFTTYQEAVGSGRFDVAIPVGRLDRSIPSESDGEKQQTQGETETNDKDTTDGVKRTGGLRSYIHGSALFDGNRLAGLLDDEDTEILLLAMGQFQNGYLSVSDEKGTVTFLIKETVIPHVQMSLGEAPHAVVTLALFAEIELDTSGNAEERWDSELKGQLEKYIVMELNRVFEQCKLLNSDAMRFGRYACMQFSSVEAWRDYAWKEKYKNMTAEFGVTVKLNDRIISSHIE
ncbi:MAG: hypothetical protein DBX63_05380 [Clostridia bacterium]|nr:MAG: hypothetical protein DBX63_05380 [Clostridia bacterium]